MTINSLLRAERDALQKHITVLLRAAGGNEASDPGTIAEIIANTTRDVIGLLKRQDELLTERDEARIKAAGLMHDLEDIENERDEARAKITRLHKAIGIRCRSKCPDAPSPEDNYSGCASCEFAEWAEEMKP